MFVIRRLGQGMGQLATTNVRHDRWGGSDDESGVVTGRKGVGRGTSRKLSEARLKVSEHVNADSIPRQWKLFTHVIQTDACQQNQ